MEILVVELNICGKKKYTLGFYDWDETLHELNPYQVAGNNNELRKECVSRWVYFSDIIKEYGAQIFQEQYDDIRTFKF